MSAGNKKTHEEQRRRLRRRLRSQGVPEHEIERQADQLRKWQNASRRAGVNPNDLGAVIDQTHAELRLDDSKHKPTHVDPVLRGTARATGDTARAVRSRKTFTKYQLDQKDQNRA